MEEEISICPYTGLRPFTEEESIYFKGRDEHIDQATRQLEKNKFIMLTGASGDGKSSLVFAGILPNARAGFLKSQFSNWAVAQFRPERDPLQNLSAALAKQLGIANVHTLRTELTHGFSALVDLYKASPIYTDVRDSAWQQLDEKEKSVRKRTGANLIIVADQFEEFFTNPENFQKGVPSQEASLVTNLLLETARIALEEKLPIYVIITMRSDFIGQCASFRGLPEAIGFSQFFVPRLNRTQLQEVIEEPATLSGNRISRRLTERLIFDMVEGTDQLPILQHALNQIWKMADDGKSEMDLIHYAMVGGMPGRDLPETDAQQFKIWFGNLSEKIRACYADPDLQNVLNTHADKLFAFASEYLSQQYNEIISASDSNVIIEATFKCLTKIDNGRAVRNRMTLSEITAIINLPHVDIQTAGKLLNIFREPGNTLLRPFTDEVPELTADSILDITHESLIRNWDKLDQWARDEFASYTTFLDFSQQLNRWTDSGKSNAFLLYIGPLTYFETFFNRKKPNAAWIARYLGDDISEDQQQTVAEGTLANANEFLRRSASKHIVTRTFMKYGAGKIAAVLALIVLLTMSAVGVKRYLDQRNPGVLQEIKEQSIVLANKKKTPFSERAAVMVQQLRGGLMTVPDVVNAVDDTLEKIVIVQGIASRLVLQGKTEPAREIAQAIQITDSLMDAYPIVKASAEQRKKWLRMVNDWRAVLGLAYFYNPTDQLMDFQKRNARRGAKFIMEVLDRQPKDFSDMVGFDLALETTINFDAFTPQERAKIISAISPFKTAQPSAWVASQFSRDKQLVRGYQGYSFKFNGLFQELGCLYASEGNARLALQSVDSLLKYNEGYYQRDYTNMLDNATNIVSSFYRGHHVSSIDSFVSIYCQHKNMSEVEFYQRVIGRSEAYQLTRNSELLSFWPEDENLNLQYDEAGEIAFFFGKLRQSIAKIPNADEQNLAMAIAIKNENILIAHKGESAGKPFDRATVYAGFDKSLGFFTRVSAAEVHKPTEFGQITGESITMPAGTEYLYPDLIQKFHPLSPRDYRWNHMSEAFLDYLVDRDLLKVYFNDANAMRLIEEWLKGYHAHAFGGAVFMRHQARPESFQRLESALQKIPASSEIDLSILYFYLGFYARQQKDEEAAAKWYAHTNPRNFANFFQNNYLAEYEGSGSMKIIANAFACFYENKNVPAAQKILDAFKNPINRSSFYAWAAIDAFVKTGNGTLVQQLLDSGMAEMKRTPSTTGLQANRFMLGVAASLLHPTENSMQLSRSLLKNQPVKLRNLSLVAGGLAWRGNLAYAMKMMPENISDEDQAYFLEHIPMQYLDNQTTKPEWSIFEHNTFWFKRQDLIYYQNEGN